MNDDVRYLVGRRAEGVASAGLDHHQTLLGMGLTTHEHPVPDCPVAWGVGVHQLGSVVVHADANRVPVDCAVYRADQLNDPRGSIEHVTRPLLNRPVVCDRHETFRDLLPLVANIRVDELLRLGLELVAFHVFDVEVIGEDGPRRYVSRRRVGTSE